MNTCLRHDVRQDEHDRMDQQMADFLARGGTIERLPIGAMAETTPRKRINPSCPPIEERKAAKRAARATPTPAEPRAPRVRKPKEPKPRVKNGPAVAQPGTQKGAILQLLKNGPLTSQTIADRLGMKPEIVRANLHALKVRNRVRASGPRREYLWAVAA
jgi:predicted Rossmann fold nucleotide-binding protein DprA/Smf involved in DNA uptake